MNPAVHMTQCFPGLISKFSYAVLPLRDELHRLKFYNRAPAIFSSVEYESKEDAPSDLPNCIIGM